MTPTTLAPEQALALGRRRAAALRALRLLEYAAVVPDYVLTEEEAVAHAVRLLRGPRKPEPPRIVWLP